MAIYNIQGNTVEGSKVNEDVEADNAALALSQIHSRYGMLRRPYQIVKRDVLKGPYGSAQKPKRSYPILKHSDEEILQMIDRIKTNQSSSDELHAVKEHFEPIINAAVNSPSLLLSEDERQEIADQISQDILMEFSISFSPYRGRLLSYIKMKVRSRVDVYYKRLKYVNANDKKKRRFRSTVLKEHYDEISRQPDHLDDETARLGLISTIQSISEETFNEVARKAKEDVYERIAELGFHDLLRSKRQKLIFNLTYGPERLKQIEIATKLRITQGTVSVNLKRAKENVLKKIREINLDEG
ncbi:hypothetical protein [Paenibacillus hubeiensis]|uniref:hypothetical protein n=1 Tax=Paenibacillus hubeiensis TaxID=3077330 RepID=UPI0031B9E2D6